MIPTHRIPEHPGAILLEEFLVPLEMSQSALAEHLGITVQRVNEIVNGRRGITPMNLQTAYDLARAREDSKNVKPIRKRA